MKESDIKMRALELALVFTDEASIPKKFKEKKEYDYLHHGKKVVKRKKEKEDTIIKRRFDENVKQWCFLIETLFSKAENDLAKRLIHLKPRIEPNIKNITDCKDFLDVMDYLELRRDIENCDADELGRLAMLTTAFQRRIEDVIKPPLLKSLKNIRAQELMDRKTVIIDGIEINLWQGHSYKTIQAQEGWNKIVSYTELNRHSEGENGDVVFTGTLQIPRKEAAEYAIKLGFRVHSNISKEIEFLVIGSENVSPNKIAKSLELNDKGAHIRFVDEITFLSLVNEYL